MIDALKRMRYNLYVKENKFGMYGTLFILMVVVTSGIGSYFGIFSNCIFCIILLLAIAPGLSFLFLWIEGSEDKYKTIMFFNFDYFKIKKFVKRIDFIKDTLEFTKDKKYEELLEEAQKSLYIKLSSIYNKVYIVTDRKIDKSALPLLKSMAIEKFGVDKVKIVPKKRFKMTYYKFKALKEKNFPSNPFKLKILSETIYSDDYLENGYDM